MAVQADTSMTYLPRPLRWLPWLSVGIYSVFTVFLAIYGNEWAPLALIYLCFPAGHVIGLLAALATSLVLPSHGPATPAQHAHANWLLWCVFIVLGSAWQYWLWSMIRQFINKFRER